MELRNHMRQVIRDMLHHPMQEIDGTANIMMLQAALYTVAVNLK